MLFVRRKMRRREKIMQKALRAKAGNTAQIKSKKRVHDYGEVFTPSKIVKAMCDLIPDWTGNVLEPSCGNGNFLVEIANRKLAAGMTAEQAARTIFGVDILQDNIDEAIARMAEILPGTEDILRKNIVCGDALKPESIWFLEGKN